MTDDVTITAKVKSELVGEKSVKVRHIDVDTVAGVVRVKNELRIGPHNNGAAFR